MPIQTVELPDEQNRFIAQEIESGHYPDAAAVMRAALRSFERERREYDHKLTALRAAIAEGDTGEVVEGDVFAQVLAELGLAEAKQ